MSAEDQAKLVEAFYNFDDDKDGWIPREDLEFIVTSNGNPLTGADLQEFLQEADFSNTGMIDYKTFAQILLAPDE